MPVLVENSVAEAALFDAGAVNLFPIGALASIGSDGEFADIVGTSFRPNDVIPLLSELLYGDGVSGVEINTIDNDTVTLELTNILGTADTVVIDNIAGAIAAVSQGAADTANGRPQFAFFDLAVANDIRIGSTEAVGTSGEFADIVGRNFRASDVAAVLDELLFGDGIEGVEINTLDDDSLTLELRSADGVVDTVALDNVGAILDLALGFADAGDSRAQFAFFDVAVGDPIAILNTGDVGNGEFAGIVGDEVDSSDLTALFSAILEGGGVEGVELITVDDDSVTVALSTAGGATDVVLFDNASAVLSDVFSL